MAKMILQLGAIGLARMEPEWAGSMCEMAEEKQKSLRRT